ncbi:hypothetical protein ACWEKT_02815 [Nocardia takedensis]
MPKSSAKLLIANGKTNAHVRSVGDEQWVVSFLPGRTLTREQADCAVRIVAELDALHGFAAMLGLTLLEVVGLVTMAHHSDRPRPHGEASQVHGRSERVR